MTPVASRRVVIFDLDDTLILEAEVTLAAARAAAALAHERAGVDAARFADAAAAAAERHWKEAPGYAADGEAHGIWWGEALWGDFAGEDEVSRAMRAFLPGFRESVWRDALASAGGKTAVDGAGRRDAALVAELQRAYVGARRSREIQHEKLSRTTLARYFEAIVISGEAGVGKPDPRVFAIVLERLGVEADAATMVGDSLVRDVGGAQRAGLRAIWLDRESTHSAGPVPDARIRRLSDLRASLDALERRPASPRATS